MKLNLIIDGNYLLNKLVFTLHKSNILYGQLGKSLNMTYETYRTMYQFNKIFFVSDSREKSWRRELYPKYKKGRKKDTSINWDFVYEIYEEFKNNLKNVYEADSIEGDDMIHYIIKKTNADGESNMILCNDYDIKQELVYNLEPLFINFMYNDMQKSKLFLPKNYRFFKNEIDKYKYNAFDDSNDYKTKDFFNKLLQTHSIIEVDGKHSLLVKLVSGDNSDNIKSVYIVESKGKFRGIGEKGAISILDKIDIDLDWKELFNEIAYTICEKKKVGVSEVDGILKRLEENKRLIYLDNETIPHELHNKIEELWKKNN